MTFLEARPDRRLTWSNEETQRLSALTNEGKSSGQIARELGITRNAVIGKIHRIGLKLSGRKESQEPRARRRRELANGAPRRPPRARFKGRPAAELRRVGEPVSLCVRTENLDMINDCRFVTTDQPPHRHCGHPRYVPGRDHISVYCEYHEVITRNQNFRQRGTGQGPISYWTSRFLERISEPPPKPR